MKREIMATRPPVPPFTRETAIQKVRLAEDGWNSRDPEKVSLASSVSSNLKNGKIASEHLYWDHASVLAQLGVIDRAKGLVKGVERPRTLLEWAGIKAGSEA